MKIIFFRLRGSSDGLEDEIMLLHLFEMQDRNSAWSSICFKHHPDEATAAAGLQHYCSSPLHCHTKLPPAAHNSSPSGYVHKHPDREIPVSSANAGSQNYVDRHNPDFVTRLCQSQSICGSRPRVSRIANNLCHSDVTTAAAAPFSCSPGTKSEPATRSNSVECEKDFSRPAADTTNDVTPTSLDLSVPNGLHEKSQNYMTPKIFARRKISFLASFHQCTVSGRNKCVFNCRILFSSSNDAINRCNFTNFNPVQIS